MKFRTEIEIENSNFKIDYKSKILTIGSCFAQNIGEYFIRNRFNILCNPFGVLYNPVSVYNSIKLVIDNIELTKEDLIENQSEWHSFYHHSSFSHHDQSSCLKRINESTSSANKFLKNTNVVVITYGTSYVYKHKAKNTVVSNCHKLPQSEFEHFSLSSNETKATLKETINLLKSVNETVKIIFTVSPVRHWKDGAISNQISKSTLLLAINDMTNEYEDCLYFPSYEIVMDDLRDYRFYAEDMLHPNKIATDYIWKKFAAFILDESSKLTMKEIEKIVKARAHKVRNPQSEKHQDFLKSQIIKIESLKRDHPNLNLNEDENYFKNQLI